VQRDDITLAKDRLHLCHLNASVQATRRRPAVDEHVHAKGPRQVSHRRANAPEPDDADGQMV
jgi:hypothetical protein